MVPVRFVLAGAESTGKTTLALRLAEFFDGAYVPEFARGHAASVGHTAENPHPWVSDDFLMLASEQQKLEDAAARTGKAVVFCDTDVFALAIWHERYTGEVHPQLANPRLPQPRFYLLTHIGTPFIQDGQRDRPHLREWMHRRFAEELPRLSYPFIALPADREEAFKKAVEYCGRVAPAVRLGSTEPRSRSFDTSG